MTLHVVRHVPFVHRRRRSRVARLRRLPSQMFLVVYTGVRLMRFARRLWRLA